MGGKLIGAGVIVALGSGVTVAVKEGITVRLGSGVTVAGAALGITAVSACGTPPGRLHPASSRIQPVIRRMAFMQLRFIGGSIYRFQPRIDTQKTNTVKP